MAPPRLGDRSGISSWQSAVGFPYRHRHRRLSWTWGRAGCALQMAFTLLTLPFHFIPSSNSVVKNTAPPGDSLAREGQRLPQPDQDETLGCRYAELICRNAHDCNFCTFVWNLQLLAHQSSMGIWVSSLVLILWRSSRNWIIASPPPPPTPPNQHKHFSLCSWEWHLGDEVHKDAHILPFCHFWHERTLNMVVYILHDWSHISLSLPVVLPILHLFITEDLRLKNTNLVEHVKEVNTDKHKSSRVVD